jgi:hypothetical protein
LFYSSATRGGSTERPGLEDLARRLTAREKAWDWLVYIKGTKLKRFKPFISIKFVKRKPFGAIIHQSAASGKPIVKATQVPFSRTV